MSFQLTPLERTMQQIKRRRRRRSADEWRAVLARYTVSNLTVEDFCEREAMSTASFYHWRSVLSGSGAEAAPRAAQSAAATSAGFVDLGGLDAGGSRVELRLDLGGGVLLHLVRG